MEVTLPKIGTKCKWMKLPGKQRSRGYNPSYICLQTWTDVTVVDIHDDNQYIKLHGRIAFGACHTNWYSVKDVIRHNNDEIFSKFI